MHRPLGLQTLRSLFLPNIYLQSNERSFDSVSCDCFCQRSESRPRGGPPSVGHRSSALSIPRHGSSSSSSSSSIDRSTSMLQTPDELSSEDDDVKDCDSSHSRSGSGEGRDDLPTTGLAHPVFLWTTQRY